MGAFDAFRFDGRHVLVVGGASGIGAAAAQLAVDAGAEVTVMDRQPVTVPGVRALSVDLADRASIDAAVAQCPQPVHALLACAGVADGTPGIERINFVGHRHLINQARAAAMLPRGSAIGFVASAAGLGWEASLTEIRELLEITDFDGATAWFHDHNWADYLHTKQVICGYVASASYGLLREGIRLNAICPGPTDTPLALANKDLWLGFGADFRAETGVEVSTPMEQAYPLLFLCSQAGRAINGVVLTSDLGYLAAGVSGSYPPATPVANFLLMRS
jgi:NAD(P)-dependent dehydrogenase (short-subunit alcohol dehydrogenase family)